MIFLRAFCIHVHILSRGIFGPNFMMKALEWGLAKDRTPYTWLGFDSPAVSAHPDSSEKSSAEANSTSVDTYTNSRRRETSKRSKNQADPIKTKSLDSSASLPTPPDSPTMQAVGGSDVGGGKRASEQTRRVRFSRNSSRPLDIFLDSLHLLSSMRYHGYAAGPPANQRAPAAPRDKRAFFKRALWRFVRSHIISTTCVLVIIHRHTYLPQYLGTVLPFLSPKVVQSICNALSYFCVGVSLHAQMLVGFEGASMFFLLLSLLPWPSRLATAFAFDAREWTPLFWQPYNITSVAEFWALRWHGLFRKPFLATGFEPTRALVEPVLGKRAARAIGSFVVFALSLWLHDQGMSHTPHRLCALPSEQTSLWNPLIPAAFASARWNLPATALRPLSFWERYGAYAFFLGQSVAIVLESAYLSQRRRQISTKSHHSQTRFPTGLLARAWGLSWIVVLGCLAGRSW